MYLCRTFLMKKCMWTYGCVCLFLLWCLFVDTRKRIWMWERICIPCVKVLSEFIPYTTLAILLSISHSHNFSFSEKHFIRTQFWRSKVVEYKVYNTASSLFWIQLKTLFYEKLFKYDIRILSFLFKEDWNKL